MVDQSELPVSAPKSSRLIVTYIYILSYHLIVKDKTGIERDGRQVTSLTSPMSIAA